MYEKFGKAQKSTHTHTHTQIVFAKIFSLLFLLLLPFNSFAKEVTVEFGGQKFVLNCFDDFLFGFDKSGLVEYAYFNEESKSLFSFMDRADISIFKKITFDGKNVFELLSEIGEPGSYKRLWLRKASDGFYVSICNDGYENIDNKKCIPNGEVTKIDGCVKEIARMVETKPGYYLVKDGREQLFINHYDADIYINHQLKNYKDDGELKSNELEACDALSGLKDMLRYGGNREICQVYDKGELEPYEFEYVKFQNGVSKKVKFPGDGLKDFNDLKISDISMVTRGFKKQSMPSMTGVQNLYLNCKKTYADGKIFAVLCKEGYKGKGESIGKDGNFLLYQSCEKEQQQDVKKENNLKECMEYINTHTDVKKNGSGKVESISVKYNVDEEEKVKVLTNEEATGISQNWGYGKEMNLYGKTDACEIKQRLEAFISNILDADNSEESNEEEDQQEEQIQTQTIPEKPSFDFTALDGMLNKYFDNSSVWKNDEGGFNTARLASDSIAGVILGTTGGIVTSKIIKKNQIKSGFESLKCTIGGQDVANFGDEFKVGVK